MNHRLLRNASLLTALFTVLLVTAAVSSSPALAAGKSSSGGGGTAKVVESRVTGYITAIDYVNHTLTVGASYYGTGLLWVSSSTSVSVNNVNSSFDQLKLGDWAEARYVWSTKEATKLSITRP